MTKILLILSLVALTLASCKQPKPKIDALDRTIKINDDTDITFYLDETNLQKTLSLSLGNNVSTPLEVITVPRIDNIITHQLNDEARPTELSITAQNLGHLKLYLRSKDGYLSNAIDIRVTTRKLDIVINPAITAKVDRELNFSFTPSIDNQAPYSVKVDDPTIISARITSNNEVAITGLKKGITELVIIDANGYESDTADIDVQNLDLAFTIKPTGTPNATNATQLILQLDGKFSNKTLAFTTGEDIVAPYKLVTSSGSNNLATFNPSDNSLSAQARGESVIYLVDDYGTKSNSLTLKVWDIQVTHEPSELTMSSEETKDIKVNVTGEDAFVPSIRDNIIHGMRSYHASVSNPDDPWINDGKSLSKVFKLQANNVTDTPDRFMSINNLTGSAEIIGTTIGGGAFDIFDQTFITVE